MSDTTTSTTTTEAAAAAGATTEAATDTSAKAAETAAASTATAKTETTTKTAETKAAETAAPAFTFTDAGDLDVGVTDWSGQPVTLTKADFEAVAEGARADVVAFVRGQVAARSAAMDAQRESIKAEAQKRFGADLARITGEAERGGKDLFGAAWDTISKMDLLAGNPDVIEGLARHARSVATDPGVGGGGSPAKPDGNPYTSWEADSARFAR